MFEATDRHAALDYAQVLKDLSDRHFRRASKIVLVPDNLSTHKPARPFQPPRLVAAGLSKRPALSRLAVFSTASANSAAQ